MAARDDKNTFVFHGEWREAFSEYTKDEQADIYNAIIDYAIGGIVPQDRFIRVAIANARITIDRDKQRYEEKCERNRQNIANRWKQSKRTDTTVYAHTNDNDNGSDNGSDNDSDNDIEPITNVTGKDIEKKRKAIAYPYDEVVNLWNEICSPLPQVKRLNDSRRNKIKSRLLEFSKNSEEWLPKVRELFERVVASDFLRGEKSDWQATFDWLFDNSKNWVKVMEGNYDNDRKRTTQHPNCKLGVGEFIAQDGTRRYGTGNLPPVPMDAPPRPDDYSLWSRETNTWIPYGV